MKPEAAWQNGVTLWEALVRWGDPALWQQYSRVAKPGIEMIAEALPALMANDRETTNRLSREASDSALLFRKIETGLIDQFRCGRLAAIGYATPRKPEDRPAIIPQDVWTGRHKVNWHESTVKGSGLDFLSVRAVLTPNEDALATQQLESLPAPVQRHTGRPSKKEFILEAYDALMAAGRIKLTKPRNRMDPLIREWLATQYPDRATEMRELGEETIRKYTTDLFSQAKAAQKQ